MPGLGAGPSWRVVSPAGGSILITSAPRSPSCWAAHGPSTTVVQSRILTPSNGPAIDATSTMLSPRLPQVGHACAGNVTGQTSYGRRNAEAISANVASAKEEDARSGEQAANRGQLGSGTHCCRPGDKPGWRDRRSRADDDHLKKRRRHHHSPPSTSWRRPIRLT